MIKDKLTNCKTKLQIEREHYISTINHDLKIPTLAQIRALELLANEDLGCLNADQKELVELTLNSCRFLYGMLCDILKSYNLDNKNINLNIETFDIVKEFKEILIRKNTEHRKKNVNVRVNSKEKRLIFSADKEKFQEAMNNIIDYCLSHTLDNTYIQCDITNNKNELEIILIYENPFYKKSQVVTSDFDKVGSLLKLQLAEKILIAHKGTITNKYKFPFCIMNIRIKSF